MYSCPSCQSTLQTPPVGWHADGLCDSCGGVWISANTLDKALQSWRINERFIEKSPSTDFCPVCGPVPLDEGILLGQPGLGCSSCNGVFMRKPLKYERPSQTTTEPIVQPKVQSNSPPISDVAKVGSAPQRSPKIIQPKTQPSLSPKSKVMSPKDSTLLPTVQSQKEPGPIPPKFPALSSASHSNPQVRPTQRSELPLANQSSPSTEPSDLKTADFIWFGILLVGIITSLMFWMNP